MMQPDLQLKRIEDKVQMLVKKYQHLKQENLSLHKLVESKTNELLKSRQKATLLEENTKLQKLKGTKSQAGLDEGDKKNLQSLISEYIREIDRCISRLSD
ncbi:MAG TPA: hypothetical protein VMV20_02665 [Chitinophagaceae bacterium]|nr:hypothetical protein [Chitinophagaceae bacterium]